MICALGRNVSEAWLAMCQGRSAISAIQSIDVSRLRFKNGAEVSGFDPTQHFEHRELQLLDRFAQFAVVSARQAINDAGLCISAKLSDRVAVVTGSAEGGILTIDSVLAGLYGENRNHIHPASVPKAMANAGASLIAMEFGITGPTYTICSACASATHAIGQAFWMIRNGAVEAAIAGGSEAPFSYGNLCAWDAMRVIAPDTCRPFCRARLGTILGEGAGMLVLEDFEAAKARGAHIYAEIIGFGMSADASHITQPSVEGPSRAMRAALTDAGIGSEYISYINAHGTGTSLNDVTEIRAIRQVFGKQAHKLAVSSTKSMHGHALGASGALEAIATALALSEGILPPTANFTQADPDCDLDVVPNRARSEEAEYALSNSFALGGLNAVLAFRKLGNAMKSKLYAKGSSTIDSLAR
jgi:nodulation protein E